MDELERFPGKKKEVANLINYNILKFMKFQDENQEIKKEFARIQKQLFKGKGESACMAVARFTGNIVASSNLKDILTYCNEHSIVYLTTMDFLCYAIKNAGWSALRCNAFINAVLKAGSKLPVTKMEDYSCREF